MTSLYSPLLSKERANDRGSERGTLKGLKCMSLELLSFRLTDCEWVLRDGESARSSLNCHDKGSFIQSLKGNTRRRSINRYRVWSPAKTEREDYTLHCVNNRLCVL